jgi:hypothetical protein
MRQRCCAYRIIRLSFVGGFLRFIFVTIRRGPCARYLNASALNFIRESGDTCFLFSGAARVELANLREQPAIQRDGTSSLTRTSRRSNKILPYSRIRSTFVLIIPLRVSACLEAAPPIGPAHPSPVARAARLKTFEREQLIVDYLNRGVSVAEIAARVGLSEKRMRAVIREILVRRMPHAPEEFAAIQVSRLNEAPLVAYSAMTGANLKAVDRVVRIVRDLDRYHGAFAAAGRRRTEATHPEVPVAGTMAFGAALVCRPEFAPQEFEDIEFEPGVALASDVMSVAGPAQERNSGFAAPDVIARSPQGDVAIQLSVERPTAPGSLRFARDDWEGAPSPTLTPAHDDRPENPAQGLEKVESAPGIATSPGNPDLAAHARLPQDTPAFVAPRHGSAGRLPGRQAPGKSRARP